MKKPEKHIGFGLNIHYITYLEENLRKIESVVDLAGRWCEDQENGMTDGTICIAALKDIRRILREDK
jgi:hypothetical protein